MGWASDEDITSMKALILAGGLGKRLALKTKPKCMAIVNGKPILEHLVEHLKKAGIIEIIIKVHHKPQKIMKYFGTRVLYYYESKLLDPEQSERVLQPWLGDEYIVMNGDTLTNVDLKKFIEGAKSAGCNFHLLVNDKTGAYGGTKYVNLGINTVMMGEPITSTGYTYTLDGLFYFDCGTPQKLAKARRFYAKS